MDYLKSGWKTVVGGQDSPPSGSSGAASREHNVADTVNNLSCIAYQIFFANVVFILG